MKYLSPLIVSCFAATLGTLVWAHPDAEHAHGHDHTPTTPPKNIIVMVADGAGYNTLAATRFWTGEPLNVDAGSWQQISVAPYALRGDDGPAEGCADDEQAPHFVYEPLKNYDPRPVPGMRPGTGEVPGRLYPRAFAGYEWNRDFRPDSANTMTALMTGVATYPGAINMDGNGKPLRSLAHAARAAGKRVGVVSSVQWNHATPASAAGGQNASRSNYHELAEHLLTVAPVDVLAGPNHPEFDEDGGVRPEPNDRYMPLPLWQSLKAGEVSDADGAAWTLVQDTTAIRGLATGETPQKLLIVPQVYRTLQAKRSSNANPQETTPGEDPFTSNLPTLVDLTRAALNAVDDDEDGFFLMVEGGAVDWAMHDNRLGRMIEEYRDFDDAVGAVVAHIDAGTNGVTWDNTLLIVTADHDHLLLGPNATEHAYEPVEDRGPGVLPGHKWFFDHHSNQLVPLFVRGLGAEAVVALAQQDDAAEIANQAVGRGKYLHQPLIGKHLIDLVDNRQPLPVGVFHTNRTGAKALTPPVAEESFSFAIFGDRTGGPDEGVAILADAVRDTNYIEPDLVMTVGDLVQGYNENPRWQEQADEYSEIMNQLTAPWYPVAGNHDIYWRDTDKSGDEKPEGEHEANYEAHFGPLWYAIEHKNSWFIVLYSDEGDPETGEYTFHKPASQRMSDEQFDWLKQTLADARDANHVFVFLHHPRWHGVTGVNEKYGDDWNKVHQELVKAGNVSAVFAGHIHHMRYDGDVDGIEYFTLATVGGGQSGEVPRAGFLHHYNLVNVRADRFSMTAIPVGAAIDPRSLTEDVLTAARALAKNPPEVSERIALSDDGSANTTLEVTLTNPTTYAIDFTLTPESRDSHWSFSPDHDHGHLAAGESKKVKVNATRLAGPADTSFALPTLRVDAELLTDSSRIPVPAQTIPLASDVSALRDPDAPDRVLRVDGTDAGHVRVESADLSLPDGPMTFEAWLRAEDFGDRVGLATKAQSSDFGLFVSNGRPSFSLFLGDGYVTVRGAADSLKPGTWHHLAGVYDGAQVQLFVDGQLVESKPGSGNRRRNDLPLLIGADVGGGGAVSSPFVGDIDDVRLSTVARYAKAFEPATSFTADEQAVLLLSFDELVGGMLLDDSPRQLQLTPGSGATVVEP